MKRIQSNGNGRKLHSVIFDMDGVIVDSHPAHCRAWQRFLQTLGRTISEDDLNYILDGRKRTDILAHFFGDLTELEIRQYGNLKDEFFRQISLDVKPVDGVLDLLDDLKRHSIALALATSAGESRTRTTLRRLRLSNHFKVIVTGNDVAQGKPDPTIYRLACNKLGVSPQNVLAVEDAVSGVRAAKGAGIGCIAVAGHEFADTLRQAGADRVIGDFVGVSVAELQTVLMRYHRSQLAKA
jgi:HAD superfamily hydrolase (TIGR01509 family)